MNQQGIQWRSIVMIGCLGIASGFPLMLTTSTLQVWLADQWPAMTTLSLGAISLLGLPYLLKGLWSPYLDRHRVLGLSHREGWAFLMQLIMAALFLTMALLGAQCPMALVLLALLITIASSTQDSTLDAHRIEIIPPRLYGIATSSYQLGYRLAILLTGGGALILADQLGWYWVYLFAALFCFAMALWLLFLARNQSKEQVEAPRIPWFLSLKSAFSLPNVGSLLVLVMLLKISDAAIGNLAQIFFLKALHLSKSQIGFLYKGVGLGCTVAGSFIAGFSLNRFSLHANVYAIALLQCLAILPYLVCAMPGDTPFGWVITAVVLESLTAGMIGSACIVLLMLACQKTYVATQYACLVLFALLPRIALGAPMGLWVDHWGWLSFFVLTLVLSLLPFICFALPRFRALLYRLGSL